MTVVALADICSNTAASLAGCAGTAALTRTIDPVVVLAAGDTMNSPNATYSDYSNFYHPRWGTLAPITRPVPGNHEYNDPTVGPGAEGYRAYYPDTYAPPTGPLYYSFNQGDWHFVGIDTDQCQSGENCPGIGTSASTQVQWLTADLAADQHTCDIVYGHHPAYSSPAGPMAPGRHGSIPHMQPAWDRMVAAGVDIYISGHDHDYERFTTMNADGNAVAVGTRQFVVGTGGALGVGFDTVLPTSEVHLATTGVLVLTLTSDSYSWQFVNVNGTVQDAGGPVSCH